MSQEHSITGKRKRSAKFYAVRISDCKNCSGWPSGTTFFAQRGAWKEIQEYDKVVYHDHQGVTHVGFVNFAGNDIILTKSMSPIMFPVPPMILPRKEIKRCDLIISSSRVEVVGGDVDRILERMCQLHRLESMKKAASNGCSFPWGAPADGHPFFSYSPVKGAW